MQLLPDCGHSKRETPSVTQVDERWHVGNTRIDILPIVRTLGAVNLKLIHDRRYMLYDTARNLKYLE